MNGVSASRYARSARSALSSTVANRPFTAATADLERGRHRELSLILDSARRVDRLGEQRVGAVERAGGERDEPEPGRAPDVRARVGQGRGQRRCRAEPLPRLRELDAAEVLQAPRERDLDPELVVVRFRRELFGRIDVPIRRAEITEVEVELAFERVRLAAQRDVARAAGRGTRRGSRGCAPRPPGDRSCPRAPGRGARPPDPRRRSRRSPARAGPPRRVARARSALSRASSAVCPARNCSAARAGSGRSSSLRRIERDRRVPRRVAATPRPRPNDRPLHRIRGACGPGRPRSPARTRWCAITRTSAPTGARRSANWRWRAARASLAGQW